MHNEDTWSASGKGPESHIGKQVNLQWKIYSRTIHITMTFIIPTSGTKYMEIWDTE